MSGPHPLAYPSPPSPDPSEHHQHSLRVRGHQSEAFRYPSQLPTGSRATRWTNEGPTMQGSAALASAPWLKPRPWPAAANPAGCPTLAKRTTASAADPASSDPRFSTRPRGTSPPTLSEHALVSQPFSAVWRAAGDPTRQAGEHHEHPARPQAARQREAMFSKVLKARKGRASSASAGLGGGGVRGLAPGLYLRCPWAQPLEYISLARIWHFCRSCAGGIPQSPTISLLHWLCHTSTLRRGVLLH